MIGLRVNKEMGRVAVWGESAWEGGERDIGVGKE